MSESPISSTDLEIVDGAPRVAASSLAKALGFSRSRKIRELIDRNIVNIFPGLKARDFRESLNPVQFALHRRANALPRCA